MFRYLKLSYFFVILKIQLTNKVDALKFQQTTKPDYLELQIISQIQISAIQLIQHHFRSYKIELRKLCFVN